MYARMDDTCDTIWKYVLVCMFYIDPHAYTCIYVKCMHCASALDVLWLIGLGDETHTGHGRLSNCLGVCSSGVAEQRCGEVESQNAMEMMSLASHMPSCRLSVQPT
jgi:hypothetical protein